MSEIYISRQPVYGPDLEILAYGLLYRSVELAENTEHEDAGSKSQQLINAILELGLDELVGAQRAFIHCPKQFLSQGLPAPVVKNQVVLEVQEDVLCDEAALQALKKLKNAGYAIALDGFVYDESKRGLLELADIIKLDTRSLDNEELGRQVAIFKEFDVQLLANKVGSHEDYDRWKGLGFDLFRGNFLSTPRVLKEQLTPSNKAAIIQLLATLQEPTVDFTKLVELIANDISLSHRILRYINSAMFSLRKPVDSIHKAVTMIGLKPIKSWVSIIAMSRVDDKPQELMTQSLVRAKMCELLAAEAGLEEDVAFTIGLFSNLDAIMDQQLRDLLAALPLSDDTYAAILRYEGELGSLLALVLDYEYGDWDAVQNAPYTANNIKETYLDAVRWAKDVGNKLLAE